MPRDGPVVRRICRRKVGQGCYLSKDRSGAEGAALSTRVLSTDPCRSWLSTPRVFYRPIGHMAAFLDAGVPCLFVLPETCLTAKAIPVWLQLPLTSFLTLEGAPASPVAKVACRKLARKMSSRHARQAAKCAHFFRCTRSGGRRTVISYVIMGIFPKVPTLNPVMLRHERLWRAISANKVQLSSIFSRQKPKSPSAQDRGNP